jgi:GR25 family glycosyltransferase involved in LPS biosynthesis
MDRFDVPILFVVFNRLDTTQRVFGKIREIKPKRLFVVADGPRDDYPGEKERCAAVREYILKNIDWECDLQIRFRDKNWGVRRSPSDGISWFFSKNERGIILEDDCLPNNSFFVFVREMLDRFAGDERVMHISGNFFQKDAVDGASYYFSQIPHIWGWATWRRAWEKYDIDMRTYPDFLKRKGFRGIFKSDYCRTEWKCLLDQAYTPRFNSWDFQWTYALFDRHGMAVTPNKNLVENLGFRDDATHSSDGENPLGSLVAENMSFPLVHPASIVANKEADEYESRHFFYFTRAKYILCKVGLFRGVQKIYQYIKKR